MSRESGFSAPGSTRTKDRVRFAKLSSFSRLNTHGLGQEWKTYHVDVEDIQLSNRNKSLSNYYFLMDLERSGSSIWGNSSSKTQRKLNLDGTYVGKLRSVRYGTYCTHTYIDTTILLHFVPFAIHDRWLQRHSIDFFGTPY